MVHTIGLGVVLTILWLMLSGHWDNGLILGLGAASVGSSGSSVAAASSAGAASSSDATAACPGGSFLMLAKTVRGVGT